jgi:hypothetical protein
MPCECAISSSGASPALLRFSTLSYKRNDFPKPKKKLMIIKCRFWFSLQLLPETFLILRRTQRHIIKNAFLSPREVPLILVRFSYNMDILETYSQNSQISNVVKIRPVVAKVFHAVGRTDRHDKANSRFLQFCECAKKVTTIIYWISFYLARWFKICYAHNNIFF